MMMFMTPSENPVTEMGQDETVHLLDKGFPCHDIRKQALFKLVTEQMDKARKVLDFQNLPAAFRHRSGLNAVTTFNKVKLDSPSSDQRHGRGDEEMEPSDISQNDRTPGLDIADDDDNSDSEAPAVASEVSQPTPEKSPPDQSDGYILSLVRALDYVREVELGLCPIIVNLDLDGNLLMGLGSGTGERPTKLTNRRMRWTISQNDPGEQVNENSQSAASSEDESLEEFEEPALGGGDSGNVLHYLPVSIVLFFLLLLTSFEVIGQYSEYFDMIAWPSALWDRLVNLSLLQWVILQTAWYG